MSSVAVSYGGPGSTAAAGLKVMPGARPAGMGSAYVGLAEGLDSLFFNPGGISTVEKPEISLVHAQYLEDTSLQMLAYGQSVPVLGTLAGAVTVLDYGSFDRTGEKEGGLFGGSLGSANPQDLFVSLGWGRAMPRLLGMERLRLGAVMKMSFQQLSGKVYPGFGVSAGALWDAPVANLRLGTAVDNLGGAAAGEAVRLPISWVWGGSYGSRVGRNIMMLYTLDWRLSVDTTMNFGFGAEALVFDLVSLRGGWRGGGAEGGGTFGVGLSQPLDMFEREILFRLDYNMGKSGALGDAHRFQLSARIGGTPLHNLGTLRLDRSGSEPVLSWEGTGQAWQVLVRGSEEEEWRQLTDRPVETNRFPLIGLEPGHYRFKVVEVDQYNPASARGTSTEMELTIQPSLPAGAGVEKGGTPAEGVPAGQENLAPPLSPEPGGVPATPIPPPPSGPILEQAE